MRTPRKQTLVESVGSRVESFYLNEYADKDSFKKLPDQEKIATALHCGLCEFVNVGNVVNSLFQGKKSIDNEELAKISVKDNAYFKDIDKSAGDISKTKHHNSMKNLLNYALQINATSNRKSDGTAQFEEAAQTILGCAQQFERNSNKFRSIITREASTANSKQLGTAFYRLSVYLIQTAADILYSNSLNAEFDYNQKVPMANNIYFEYTNNVVDDMLVYINYLNAAFRSGKIFSALDGSLNEHFEDATGKIELNEGLLDTVFGMVTHFKALDLALLWPIYLTRAIAYWVLYFYTTFKTISVDIDSSIALQKQTTLTKPQFDDYKQNAMRRGINASQSLSKAEVTIDMAAHEDKKTLEKMQSNVLI